MTQSECTLSCVWQFLGETCSCSFPSAFSVFRLKSLRTSQFSQALGKSSTQPSTQLFLHNRVLNSFWFAVDLFSANMSTETALLVLVSHFRQLTLLSAALDGKTFWRMYSVLPSSEVLAIECHSKCGIYNHSLHEFEGGSCTRVFCQSVCTRTLRLGNDSHTTRPEAKQRKSVVLLAPLCIRDSEVVEQFVAGLL